MTTAKLDPWERLLKSHPGCGKLLLRVVGAAYDESRKELFLPHDLDRRQLKPAVASGLIRIDDDVLHFTDPLVFERVTTQYITEHHALEAWGKPEAFYQLLRKLRREKLSNSVLIELHNRYHRDIVARLAEEASRGRGFWLLYHDVAQILSRLSLEAYSLVSALTRIYDTIASDLAGGAMFQAVEDLAAVQPKLARALIEELSSDPEAQVIAFMPQLLRGVAKHSFRRWFDHALQLSLSPQLAFLRAGVIALSTFDYDSAVAKRHLRKAFGRLSELVDNEKDEILATVVFGYSQLLRYESDTATNALVRLSARNSPAVQQSLSQALLFQMDTNAVEEWFGAVLVNLAAFHPENVGTLEVLSQCLEKVAEVNPGVAFRFLESWARCHEVSSSQQGPDHFEEFDSSVNYLVRSQRPSFQAAITAWFLSDEPALHKLAARIANDIEGDELIFLELDCAQLRSVPKSDIAFALNKVLGYVYRAESLSGLVFSALAACPKDRELRSFVVLAFCEYIAYNYPRIIDTFIKGKARSGVSYERSAAREIKRRVDAYLEVRQSLPRLKEFQTGTQFAARLVRAKAKKVRESVEGGVNQRSILYQLVRKVRLKAGISWFSEVDGNFTEKSNLGEFSHSIVLPKGELIDPVGQAWRRIQWQEERKGS